MNPRKTTKTRRKNTKKARRRTSTRKSHNKGRAPRDFAWWDVRTHAVAGLTDRGKRRGHFARAEGDGPGRLHRDANSKHDETIPTGRGAPRRFCRSSCFLFPSRRSMPGRDGAAAGRGRGEVAAAEASDRLGDRRGRRPPRTGGGSGRARARGGRVCRRRGGSPRPRRTLPRREAVARARRRRPARR